MAMTLSEAIESLNLHKDSGHRLRDWREEIDLVLAALAEERKSKNWWQGVAEAKQTERDAAFKAIPGRLVPGDWTEADWADLFATVEAFKARVIERHKQL